MFHRTAYIEQVCVMYILKETTVHRKETSCQRALEKLLAQNLIEHYNTHEVMLQKVNISLKRYIMKLPPPKDPVVTGFWLVLRWQVQFVQCLVVFEAVNELVNPLFPK